MQYTSNYSLPQWEDTDVVTREDVNGAMSSIDSAIAGLKAAFGEVSKIIVGSYPGISSLGRRIVSIGGSPFLVFLFNDGVGNRDDYLTTAIITKYNAYAFYKSGTISAETGNFVLTPYGFYIDSNTITDERLGFNAGLSTIHYLAFC